MIYGNYGMPRVCFTREKETREDLKPHEAWSDVSEFGMFHAVQRAEKTLLLFLRAAIKYMQYPRVDVHYFVSWGSLFVELYTAGT